MFFGGVVFGANVRFKADGQYLTGVLKVICFVQQQNNVELALMKFNLAMCHRKWFQVHRVKTLA